MGAPTMLVINNLISQHAQEAAMLWLLRQVASKAPHYSLADVAKIDGRVEAHLDGLRIAGEEGWKKCEDQLVANEKGEVFAAGVLACESANQVLMAKVLSVVEKEPKLVGGLISALGWPPFEQVQSHIQTLLQSSNPVHQLVGIGAAAVHRRHPGQFLSQTARSQDVRVKARALKAAGEFQDRSLERELTESLHHADAGVRFAAAWSGTLLGFSTAVPVLRELAESGSRHARDAASLVARRMDLAAAASWQKSLAGNPKHLRQAIMVAGAVGDPVFVPWLISLMGQLPLARPAGESFTMITGVDLAYRDLERKPPEDFNAGPTEDPKDENVEMDPDDNLPWPEPALVQKWWDKNRGQFQAGTRYLLGKPMSGDWLKTVLRDGRQRQRAAAALELAIREPGKPLFNVAAPGFRQQQILGKGEVIR
jgi:uncharacterized protein (TIGR02270 family)